MRLNRAHFVGLLVASSVALAGPAWAKEDPAEHFKQGTELYEEGDFRAALIEFERAYGLKPNFRVLYNIGQVKYQLGDYAGALGAFEQYLKDGGRRVPWNRRRGVQKDLKKLESRVAYVTVTVEPEGAEVFVDDESVGTAPLAEPVRVSAGRRVVRAVLADHRDAEETLDLAGTDRPTVSLRLEAIADDPAPTAPPPKPKPVDDESVDGPWIGWGLTAGFGTGALVFGLLALSANSSLDGKKQEVTTRDELDSTRTRMIGMAIAADVMLVGVVVAGSVATYLTIEAASGEQAGQPSVKVGLTPAGLGVMGQF